MSRNISERTDAQYMSNATSVGHCKADDCDVYIGRGRGGVAMGDVEIGTRGWLGNPYVVSEGLSREESVARFTSDFLARLESDQEFRDAVGELSGSTLGCWCQREDEDGPLCHGEVIAQAVDNVLVKEP